MLSLSTAFEAVKYRACASAQRPEHGLDQTDERSPQHSVSGIEAMCRDNRIDDLGQL
jgi:hypothetical protein